MGCDQSNCFPNKEHICILCSKTLQTSSISVNEYEIDKSHFKTNYVLGMGGFGFVCNVSKVGGKDNGVCYAMKSMAKFDVLKRSSGPGSVRMELLALTLLQESLFICRLHYAFQSCTHLYLVQDLGHRGDLRLVMKQQPQQKFSEYTTKLFVAQLIFALDYCHHSHVLHRGKDERILSLISF